MPKLLDEAKEAVNAVFSDRSEPAYKTKQYLEELSADIEVMLDSLAEAEDPDKDD